MMVTNCIDVMQQKSGEEMARLFDELECLSPLSEDYERILGAVSTITKLGIEVRKLEVDDRRITNQLIDLWTKYGTDILIAALKLAFFGVWLYTGFKFEETGALVSPVFRSLWNKFEIK